MEKQYFVWKDPNCNGINPEWIQLTPKQFLDFVNDPKNKDRHFATLTNGGCEEAGILVMEATEEVYKACEQARQRERYLREMEEEYEGSFVSLDAPVPNTEDLLYGDIVGDQDQDTEENALHQTALSKLRADLVTLEPCERDLIDILYLNNSDEQTERAIARELGLPQKTLNNRKKAIIKKLK